MVTVKETGKLKRMLPRPAFTLIEMLVTISIIGILIALLLPAVQMARASARLTQCSNNLHQIGIALHGYHDARKTLPPGCLQWRPPGASPISYKQFAWSAFILPYLEQTPLYESIDFNLPYDDPRNAPAGSARLSMFICPSATAPAPGGLGKTDYAGLFGQRLTTFKNTNNGVFIYNRAFTFGMIRDGLSQTMCVAEDTVGPECEWINGRNTFEQSGRINDPKASLIDNEIRSEHAGGAMVLFLDGHVSLLQNEIDTKILAALITRNSRDLIDQTY